MDEHLADNGELLGIVPTENADVSDLEVVADRIVGCPHEEGIDYPDGEKCPECPFWATRDRWSGDLLH
jgi:hypothetical protein